MAIEIQQYVDDFIPAVAAFNARLRAADVLFHFPERSASRWLPPIAGREIYEEYFVALENKADVRGAFVLKPQPFWIQGETVTVAHFDSPISEGFVDKAYSMVGVQLLMSALKRQPFLFSLGMGGFDEPLAQLLKRSGWTLWAIPFFFRVNHATPFLRNISAVRSTPARRLAADLGASSGLGQLAFKAVQWWNRDASVARGIGRAETFETFDTWADELWAACRSEYSLCAVRDRTILNVLYSPGHRDYVRLRVSDGSTVLGWVVAVDTQMADSRHFGNLRVATIVDCLALKKDAGRVVYAAAKVLDARGADLVISNQGDHAWGAACRANGFFEGPSNYIFAASRKLADKLQPLDAIQGRVHMTRGDGAGPINL
jgi:hypothetical protein